MQILKFILLITLSCQSMNLWAIGKPVASCEKDSLALPKVFLTGQHEAEFNNLCLEYQTLLLTVCDENMDLAYDKWLSMLEEMEAYANLNKFDLKGVKMWINVFWAKDGSISHISYYLKPQSKNVETRFLTALLTEFTKEYKFPLVHEGKYSHYGTANFPVFPRRVGNSHISSPTDDKRNMVEERH